MSKWNAPTPQPHASIAITVEYRHLSGMNAGPSRFWQTQRGLIWSNPTAGDAAHIRAALLRPRFSQLLDIAVEFGLERVREEWTTLQAEHAPEFDRARLPVERILCHIAEGFANAATRH